jgi:hypothetical protein
MTAQQAREIKIDHPEFRYVNEAGVQGYPVAVFERRMFNEPTPAQIDQYHRDEAVVKSRGGVMLKRESEIAGETPRFTSQECAAMRAAVERAMPEWRIADTWNGENCRTYSVAIKPREGS